MSKIFIAVIAALLSLPFANTLLQGEPLAVPNASFESPAAGFVSINIDFWQKSAKPDDYVESGGFLWTQLTGLFKNTAPGSSDHIDNCAGNQAVWLFAVHKVALFQDYDSLDWNDSSPTHAFDVRFEVGKSYHLTVGVIGGGGGMQEGAGLELSVYYRDSASNMVKVAATSITNSTTVFSNTTHFVDFEVNVPTVKVGDPWAGQQMGVQFLSTVTTNMEGGYWDLDNVRLLAGPVLLDPVWTNGQFQFTLRGEPGVNFEILASPNLALPFSNWTSVETLNNTTGTTRFSETPTTSSQLFYRARQLQ